MKTYFSSFYYNGIYYKMVGKYPRRGRSRSVIYNSIPSSKVLIDSLNKIKIKNNENNEKKEDKKEDGISPNINKEDNPNNETKKEDDNNNNENNKSELNEAKNQLKENLDSRIQKARGLRKLLSRKGSEKKEKLRKYFYKFYKAGIFSKVRSVRRVTKKYLERKNSAMLLQRKNNLKNTLANFETNINEKTNLKLNLDEDESTQNKDIKEDKNNITTEFKQEEDEDLNNFLKRSKTAIIKFDQKQKELEEKRIKTIQILFYKVDRINMKIIRNVFQKYYLRSKLESISIIEGGIKKKKFKRKKSKKFKKEKSSDKNGEQKNGDDKIEDKKEKNQEDSKKE